MKEEIKELIKTRDITKEDLDGYNGFEYKSCDACIFEQNKCIERDIFGHDSYVRFCTRSGKLENTPIWLCDNKCKYKTTVQEYKDTLDT